MPLKLRSLVGLLPDLPGDRVDESVRQQLREQAPDFIERMRWYAERHPELASLFPERRHPTAISAGCSPWCRRSGCVASSAGCSTRTSS